ncbi:hypothetical protein A0H81_10967 [Grifola frondosa]|uniref:Uncharacterized protein n=1 Tax=Grifola frondosa TaxID=5627 RepID=A0A1C7LX88_GRIFR|nr:hypothetical protein A0H81_10967 [Grifola frondosa]
MIVPTIEQIEAYFESLEELIVSSVSAAAPTCPGPQSLPTLSGLGPFEVPPPPPPPPPPKSFWENAADWVAHTRALLPPLASHRDRSRRVKASVSSERRQVVVVLGGDAPLGRPLILELEKKGYIVIASVSTPEAVDEIERKSHGYVRALVMDPAEPETIPYFLRSLASTLSRRFPITAAGDPHTSPSSHAYVHSVVSLLTLPSSASAPGPAPLEHLSLRDHYLPYLQATHITPLQIIQALLPLLRSSPARARDSVSNNNGKQSVVVCLPAIDARVGLPFVGAQAMSAAATLRGVEVLRREIRASSVTDTMATMKNLKVVVVDVGAVGSVDDRSSVDLQRSIDGWTPSEKIAYGMAFSACVEDGLQYGVHRKATDIAVFVDTLVEVVSSGRKSSRTLSPLALQFSMLRSWVRGDRVVVGAGARTYALASYLPSLILDGLLNLPHFLLSIRNALIPVPPRIVMPDAALPPVVPVPPAVTQKPIVEESPLSSDQEQHFEHDISETGSEADVESNEGGYGSGVVLPHVTLASVPSTTHIAKLQESIPSDQQIVPIRFRSLEVGEKYFMSVFVAVRHTPELDALRAHLSESFGEYAVPALPHLSLYYIDDADQDERALTVERLKNEFKVIRATEDSVTLNCSPEKPSKSIPASLDQLAGFEGCEIWVVKCEGPVYDWEVLECISLLSTS